MGLEQNAEKRSSLFEANTSSRKTSLSAIVVSKHILLWCSAYVLASQVYMLIIGAITPEIRPSPIVLIFAATMSMVYICSHNLAALLTSRGSRGRRDEPGAVARWLAVIVLRFDVTIWLVACCVNITFTIARGPYCFPSKSATSTEAIDEGTTCIIQRTGVGASLLALLASFTVFVLTHKTSSPFRAHLFGISAETPLLPPRLPYEASTKKAMYSQMSFQCRSSTSLARHNLTKPPTPFTSSTSNLIPACTDETTLGLGIHTPAKHSTASLLTPRPSLSSIRTRTTTSSLPPPSSPLPPLPVYIPERHDKPAVPQRLTPCYQLGRSSSGRTIRIVVPSPSPSMINLPSDLDRSESLSSIYSRSISGESVRPPLLLGDTGRTHSASTVHTVAKSPLCMVQTAAFGALPARRQKQKLDKKWSFECDSDDSDIDDAATLEARLPPVSVIRADTSASLVGKVGGDGSS
ncbi:hypothetical protein Tdes44962_MAKER02172 [Teratosphaeria destructans]|uniref:Uncharacterized protein n=1 Tax=Teratosphaeria destructans TaxID=418781 RepID=A0A9W7SUS2_9PEZI|nr:hypothetical protein Tdes44962_MAKER02172 [Teratosphaeria destructans]